MDAYQFLLLLAAHSARHTAQIREVESNRGLSQSGTGRLAPALENRALALRHVRQLR